MFKNVCLKVAEISKNKENVADLLFCINTMKNVFELPILPCAQIFSNRSSKPLQLHEHVGCVFSFLVYEYLGNKP